MPKLRMTMQSLFRLLTLTLVTATISAGPLSAQLIPVLGGQRAGTAMATFLKIGVGARAEGMGGSYVAVANDATALYWNPAGTAQFDRNELVVTHTSWPVEIRHQFVGYVHHLGANHVGFYVMTLHTDEMEETTEFEPYGTGRYFHYGDLAIGAVFSRNLTDRFSFGVGGKFIRETLAEVHANGFLIDLGTYYWTGWRTSRFAVSLSNFGSNLRPEGKIERRDGSVIDRFQDFPPPTIFRIGFATEAFENQDHRLTTSVQLNHPNDHAENVSLGLEYGWRRVLWLRAGYRINVDEQLYTVGFGLWLPITGVDFRLQYAYSSFGRLGTAHRFTACIGL